MMAEMKPPALQPAAERAKFNAEYIELCRKLALPRVLKILDLIFFDGEVCPCPSRFIGYELDSLFLKPIECFWLPREGDWLDLLEAEESASIIGIRPAKDGSGYGVQTDEGDDSEFAFGPDRLTALARLYEHIREAL